MSARIVSNRIALKPAVAVDWTRTKVERHYHLDVADDVGTGVCGVAVAAGPFEDHVDHLRVRHAIRVERFVSFRFDSTGK